MGAELLVPPTLAPACVADVDGRGRGIMRALSAALSLEVLLLGWCNSVDDTDLSWLQGMPPNAHKMEQQLRQGRVLARSTAFFSARHSILTAALGGMPHLSS